MRTLSAVGRVRRYKAWLAEWNSMGARVEPGPPPKEKRGGRRRVFVTSAALLVLVIPVYLPNLQGNEEWRTALTLLWVVACIYLVGLVLRGITQRMTKRRKAQREAATEPVEWMLSRASSSPSRSEAAKKLPDYCTRLLSS
jgi:Na+/melibiose symporter-like transporter